jgi:hypothetical protein
MKASGQNTPASRQTGEVLRECQIFLEMLRGIVQRHIEQTQSRSIDRDTAEFTVDRIARLRLRVSNILARSHS